MIRALMIIAFASCGACGGSAAPEGAPDAGTEPDARDCCALLPDVIAVRACAVIPCHTEALLVCGAADGGTQKIALSGTCAP